MIVVDIQQVAQPSRELARREGFEASDGGIRGEGARDREGRAAEAPRPEGVATGFME